MGVEGTTLRLVTSGWVEDDRWYSVADGSLDAMTEIIFEVREDEVDGGYTANALGYGIHTQGDSLEELRTMVRDAVDCYFDEGDSAAKIIRLHFAVELPGGLATFGFPSVA